MQRRNISFAFSLSIAVLTLLLPAVPQSPVEAWLTDLPVSWTNFTFVATTYNGGIIFDYEGSSDPSRGPAAVNPANTDISSCSPNGYLPGNQPSFLYSYYDSGTPAVIADDYLAFRMRLNATPLENSQVGLDSGHWYILIDIDNDGWKEFAIDVDGTIGSNRPDRMYLLYNDLPTNSVTPRSGAQRSNSDIPGNDEINLWYAAGPAATGIAQTNNHVRVLTATPSCFGGNEYWLDLQVPISAFNVGGIQKLEPGTPARFLISSSASAVDPMQKDWMLKLLSDPIFSDTWQPTVHATKTATLLDDPDGNGTASPGDVLRYDISITNTGLVPMEGVFFNDSITDPNLKLTDNVTASSGPGTIVKGNDPADTEVIVNIGAISAGATVTISFRVTILNTFMPGVKVVANQGLVSGTNFTSTYTDDPTTPSPGDATRTEVTIPPDLHITKEGPDLANAGSYITFTGTLTNYGTETATNVVLVDQLPHWMTFISSSHGAIYDSGANTVTWNLGNLPGGGSIAGWLTVLVDNTTPNDTPLTNTFSVTWQDGGGRSYGPATASKVVTIKNSPLLSISKAGPATGSPGALLTYTGTLTNYGNVTAENVTLVDHLPAGLTYVSSSHGAIYDAGANTVTWYLGSVNAGVSITGWITARVDAGIPNGTVLTDNFTLTWEDSGGTTYGPESSTVDTTIYTDPQLTITKEGPHEATVGSYITFTGTLTNVGGSAAENVTLVDYLPPGLIFVGSSHSAVYDPDTRTVTWSLGTVGSGVAIPGWIEVRVGSYLPDGTDLLNTFSVTWEDSGGGSYGPATATADVIARTSPILTVSKSGPAEAAPGDILTFTLTVTNDGGLPAQNVTLVDVQPDKYAYVSSNPPGTYVAGNVIWNLGPLSAGGTSTVSLTVRADAGLANGTPLINAAMVNWQDTMGTDYGPATAAVATTFYLDPHLQVTKTGPATGDPGDNFTYTITLTNTSATDAENVILVDYIPDGMNYIGSIPPGTFIGDNVTWALGTIAGHGSLSVSITLQADPALAEDILLDDIAAAVWEDNLLNHYGPASVAQTLVTPWPLLDIDISGPSTGEPCDTVTFTINVSNTSNHLDAESVFVQYILPSGTAYVSSTGGGTCADGVVTWGLGPLAALGSQQVSVTITYCVLPVGSEFISPVGLVWMYGGTMHGPVFDSTGTRIVAPPIPPPPPPPPTPPAPEVITAPAAQQLPSHSSTMSTRPWEPRTVDLPSITVQSATLSASNVNPGAPVTISAMVTNTGKVNGSTRLTLYINGVMDQTRGLTVKSGSSIPVQFTVSREIPGTYSVYVNGVSAGSFSVSDNLGNNIVLVLSSLCLLTALFIGILMMLRRRQNPY